MRLDEIERLRVPDPELDALPIFRLPLGDRLSGLCRQVIREHQEGESVDPHRSQRHRRAHPRGPAADRSGGSRTGVPTDLLQGRGGAARARWRAARDVPDRARREPETAPVRAHGAAHAQPSAAALGPGPGRGGCEQTRRARRSHRIVDRRTGNRLLEAEQCSRPRVKSWVQRCSDLSRIRRPVDRGGSLSR